MRAAGDGLPLVGKTARYLSVRPNVDIPVDESGDVGPGTEGMSVSPPPMANLHPLRLPREYGGMGKDPVFDVETDEMPDALAYRPDRSNPEGHGFLEPSRRMPFVEYERAIHATRPLWRRLRLAPPGFACAIIEGVMEQARQPDVAERIAGFAMADPYELSMPSIRGYAAGLLDTGYPRDALYEDLVRARDLLSERGAPDEAEDAVVDVSDFLVGWCSSFMKL